MTKLFNKSLITALSFLFFMTASSVSSAAENPFAMSDKATIQMANEGHSDHDMDKKASKCGDSMKKKEGKCGDSMKKKEGKCGDSMKKKASKCGATHMKEQGGKCGDSMKKKDMDKKKGKCGAGKCGAGKM